MTLWVEESVNICLIYFRVPIVSYTLNFWSNNWWLLKHETIFDSIIYDHKNKKYVKKKNRDRYRSQQKEMR